MRIEDGPAPVVQHALGFVGMRGGHPQWERISVFGQFAAFPLKPSLTLAVLTPALTLWGQFWASSVAWRLRRWISEAGDGKPRLHSLGAKLECSGVLVLWVFFIPVNL